MAASHGRRRSNTSPSISQAPGPLGVPMSLESGEPNLFAHPPMGKGNPGDRVVESLRRPNGLTTEGEDRNASLLATLPFSPDVRSRSGGIQSIQ
jgi:hypothetical protein